MNEYKQRIADGLLYEKLSYMGRFLCVGQSGVERPRHPGRSPRVQFFLQMLAKARQIVC